jgi:hypothetical protein
MRRLAIELILVSVVIYLGWTTPLRQQMPWYRAPARTPAAPPRAKASPPQSGAWMRDPNRTTVLDTPRPAINTPNVTRSPRPGSWMWDPNRRSPLDPPKHGTTPH